MRLSALALLICATASAEPALVRHDAISADLDLMERAYTALHPGLYRYNTPAQLHERFSALRRTLDHDVPLATLYVELSKLTASIKCGHTYPNFFNQTKAVQSALLESPTRVPFYFRWLDGRMIVTRDLTREKVLPPGSEIVAIDEIAASKILAALMTVARADGSNDAKRVALLEVQGAEKYETFDVYLPLLFPTVGSLQRLTVRGRDGATRTVTVTAETQAQRIAAQPVTADDPHSGWRLDLRDPELAILRMPTWAMFETKWQWKPFLDDAFAQLARAHKKALVIDLRGNEGGNDVGEAIVPHLIDAALSVPASAKRVRYVKVPDELAPYLDTWDPSFKNWGAAAQRFDDRFYTLTRWQETPVDHYQPQSPHFGGRVFVLVDATNSSATFQFAQLMQKQKLAQLVGTPTGGNQRGINGGAFFFLRLPKTGLEVDLPLIADLPDGHPPDAGLQPDVLVPVTVDDLVSGRDADLAAVRKLLRRP